MTSPSTSQRWVVLLTVKPLSLAKSRLDRPDRPALALAMAADTAAVAAAIEQVAAVLVVTDDPQARALLAPVATVVPDSPAAGLNPALDFGAEQARSRWPGLAIVVVAADLPALRPAALAAALSLAAGHQRAIVADAAGTGTVLLSVAAGTPLVPSFGPDSRRRHQLGGAVDLTDLLPAGDISAGLRHDVDTSDDLAVAVSLGVGPITTRVLQGGREFSLEWQTPPVSDAPAPNPGLLPGLVPGLRRRA